MALPITVPFTFGNATTTQSLSSLDADFSTVYNAVNGIGNGTVSLSNVSITGGSIAANITATGIFSGTSNVSITSTNGPVSINTNGTNAMYIDASQNVGIGTTSPANKLDVAGRARFLQDAVGTNGAIILRQAASDTEGAFIQWVNNANTTEKGWFTVDTSSNMKFATVSTERMRIDASGNLLVGTTTTTAASVSFPTLVVNGGPFSKGSIAGYFWENRSATATATTNWYGWYTTSGTIYVYNGSANIGSINASTGAYTALSDANKKKDFEPSTLGLSAVLKLKPTFYRMKDADDSSQKELGFIAQEVKDVIPQAYVEQTSLDASGVESTYIGLNDRPIIAALVAAIQELSAKNDALEARLAALEAK